MKAFLIGAALALSLPLAACDTFQTSASQVSVASKKGRIAANDIYTAASTLGMAAVQNGLLDKAEYQRRDRQAYDVLLKVRLGQATLADLTTAAAAITATGGQ